MRSAWLAAPAGAATLPATRHDKLPMNASRTARFPAAPVRLPGTPPHAQIELQALRFRRADASVPERLDLPAKVPVCGARGGLARHGRAGLPAMEQPAHDPAPDVRKLTRLAITQIDAADRPTAQPPGGSYSGPEAGSSRFR